MPDTPKTICVKCRHHGTTGSTGIWYHQICTHPSVERKQIIDPVTGAKVYVDGAQYPNCRDINTSGECELFNNDHGIILEKGPDW